MIFISSEQTYATSY